MQGLDPGHAAEQLAAQVTAAADAEGGIGELARMRPAIGDQLGQTRAGTEGWTISR